MSNPTASGPFPVEPLLARFPASRRQLAQTVGVTLRTVDRRKQTGLCVWAADRWAVACGLHPADVWPEWWGAGADEKAPRPSARQQKAARRRKVASLRESGLTIRSIAEATGTCARTVMRDLRPAAS
jgi:hypothetical protein